MIADDLFAGAGGWDLAAQAHGIHARGVENMKEARATRDAAGLTTIHDDVWTFKPSYRSYYEKRATSARLVYRTALIASGLIASPPCQTFSTAGKGAGRKALADVLALLPDVETMTLAELREAGKAFGDERTALVLTPLWFAINHPYQWLAWEQVPTVRPVWEACAEVLQSLGWFVWTGDLQAEQYGVGQTRKRSLLLASRLGPVVPPTPTHSRYYSRTPDKLDEGVQKWVSMAEVLGRGLLERPSPTVTGGGTETGGAEPIAKFSRYTDRSDWLSSPSGITGPAVRGVEHPAATVTGGDNHYVFSAAAWAERNPDRALPAWAHNRPSTTIVGSFKPEIVAAPGYRVDISCQNAPDSVRVSVAEAGLLQSFPADMPWQGTKGKQFLQCGNAVPPLLAWHALGAAAVHHLAAINVEGVA